MSENSIQGHIERHAALIHFTGHFCAGIIFSSIYIFLLFVFYYKSLYLLLYELPLSLVFIGMFIHFKRLSFERYSLELQVIQNTSNRSGTIITPNG
jgi:hypothetical protein